MQNEMCYLAWPQLKLILLLGDDQSDDDTESCSTTIIQHLLQAIEVIGPCKPIHM